MFMSVGRVWAGRPAAEMAREPRPRRWPWSRFELKLSRPEAADMPVLVGASDAELAQLAARSFDGAEAVRHRAMMLLLTSPGERGR
jgi:hypothetical protein